MRIYQVLELLKFNSKRFSVNYLPFTLSEVKIERVKNMVAAAKM